MKKNYAEKWLNKKCPFLLDHYNFSGIKGVYQYILKDEIVGEITPSINKYAVIKHT
jgi:hypothetical protein